MPQVENLSFTVLKNDLLETIKGKCEHDPHYTKVWQMVLKRDPSPPLIEKGAQAYDATTTPQNSHKDSDEFHRWKHFSIDDGHLLRKGRICVPKDTDIRRQIFYECHDSPSAGHPGIRKTYAHVRRHFYWPGLHNDVKDYVLQCQKCQVNKAECLKLGDHCSH